MNAYIQKAILNNAGLGLMPENVNKATQNRVIHKQSLINQQMSTLKKQLEAT